MGPQINLRCLYPPAQDILIDGQTAAGFVIDTDTHSPPFRALGHGYGLAALVSAIPQRPLYVSHDVIVKLLDTATQLLKRVAEHELKIGGIEVEIAWTLIASLISLGPIFVCRHFPRLVLWRNALPKPPNKDSTNNVGRSVTEWMDVSAARSRERPRCHTLFPSA